MRGEGEKDPRWPPGFSFPLLFASHWSWLLRPGGFRWYPNLFTLPCSWDLLSRADWLMCQRENSCPLYNFTCKDSNQALKKHKPQHKKGGSCCIPWPAAVLSETKCQDLLPIPSFLTSGTWKTNTQKSLTWLQFHSLLRDKCLRGQIPRRDLSS